MLVVMVVVMLMNIKNRVKIKYFPKDKKKSTNLTTDLSFIVV